ncbi:MAG: hypothetical protein HWD58_08595 [Bacteroidota bacterium]|nr:MAG: hypothetical protein HWD58_08595 [Bacteroidota bacterium]
MFQIPGEVCPFGEGSTYALKVSTGTYSYLSAWFDWNQNGQFENSEFQQIGFNPAFSNSDTTIVLNVNVPITAQTGLTKCGYAIKLRRWCLERNNGLF